MLHTTFNLLRRAGACETGYRKLAKSLGGVDRYGRDTPIPLAARDAASAAACAAACAAAWVAARAALADRFSARIAAHDPDANPLGEVPEQMPCLVNLGDTPCAA